jgi:type IV secretion system protein VirB9
VRYVNYNAADVIQLDAVIGVATHIVLAPGERYVYHVFGDSQAYAFTYKDNHLFFKPTAEDANTNLIVVTDQRDYSFRLSYNDSRSAPALYKLVIRYPEVESRRRDEAAQKAAIERSLKAAPTRVNWLAYTRSGDAAIAPVHAWDDGRQTWLQFAPGADIPAAYRVTPDGQEVITNFHMADDRTMVLHQTSALWHLRLGDLVLAIHNETYGATPPPPHTGTTSPAVQRRVQETPARNLP